VTDPVVEVPFGTQLNRLAQIDPDGIGLVLVARDGSDQSLSWSELEAGANQWCRALATRGLGIGDRIALAVQNSVELVLATLGAWKVGGVPVPVRWDLPDWERNRLLEVVDAKIVVDSESLGPLRDLAALEDNTPVPERISPQVNGICSSGATGTPKVIMNMRPGLWQPALSDPFMTNWRRCTTPTGSRR
jgi:bile acid-coenzyme A ligase